MNKHLQSKPDILLIIVDQLRLDYLPFLEKTSELLPYHAISTTGSIPSSTEAMHTNISTGLWPKYHGFISKNPKGLERKGRGLDELLEKFEQGTITPIGHVAKAKGYSVINIGGKKETVLAMCLNRFADLQMWRTQEGIEIIGNDDDLTAYVKAAAINKQYIVKNLGELSLPLIDLAIETLKRRRQDHRLFLTLALPDLDFYGHKFGPLSQESNNHIKTIDTALAGLLQQLDNNSAIFLLGDHGCRYTTKYIIETEIPHIAKIYHQMKSGYSYVRSIDFDGTCCSQIEYDGGIFRIWFNENNCALNDDALLLLSQYGQLIDVKNPARKNHETISRSLHENLGELVVIAYSDVSFCKRAWINQKYHSLLDSQKELPHGSLPVGEHGTYNRDDALVAILANKPLLTKEYSNIEIQNLICGYLCYSKSQ